jgi:hypothetical protein
MAKPKKQKKKLPKDVSKLTADQVMRRAFGKQGLKELRKDLPPDPKSSETAAAPTT